MPAYDLPMNETARERLFAERGRLRVELGEPIQAPGQMTYGSQAAAASEVFEQQRDLALRERTERQLGEVEAALRRIEDRTYGRCVACGGPIDPARLDALPWAALCIACQRDGSRARR